MEIALIRTNLFKKAAINTEVYLGLFLLHKYLENDLVKERLKSYLKRYISVKSFRN